MSSTIEGTGGADLYAALGQSSAADKSKAESTASADRFLKMLVTQLQNQDPLNPMDNAQITSQMAQINAVTGLEKVNDSIKSLSGQFLQMQMLQGAALVGRDVVLQGDALKLTGGVGSGALELGGPASSVKVEVLGASDQVIDTIDLGAQDAGRLAFEWQADGRPTDVGYRYRVLATRGGEAVPARTLEVDRVQSVSTAANKLTLVLEHLGTVNATDVVAFN
jgi:flagellar basal-body rod modification protein FlgD